MFTARKFSSSMMLLSLICNSGQATASQPNVPDAAENSSSVTATQNGHGAGSRGPVLTPQILPVTGLAAPTDQWSMGKPTCAKPKFEPAVVISWGEMPQAADRQGDRKQNQATIQPASRSVAAARTNNARINTAGGLEKHSSSLTAIAPPSNLNVVNVGWTASRNSFSDQKAMLKPAEFRGVDCPHVQFATESFVNVSPATSSLKVAPSQSIPQPSEQGASYFTSLNSTNSAGIHSSQLEELQRLTGESFSNPTTISETYLDELQSLVQGPSVWLFTNGALLDLAPEEGDENSKAPTYLDDLQSLSPGSKASRTNGPKPETSKSRYVQVARGSAVDERAFVPPSARGFYEVVPDKDCEVVGGEALVDKFQPLTSIRLSGGSTAPPQTTGDFGNEPLNRPENSACAYLESSYPACYQTPTQFGVRRPDRYPQQFCHNPLYFEDANLERCGQSNGCLTTAGSAIQFGTQIALLPYLTTATHPNACVQALPDCPACQEFGPEAYFPRWSWKAAAVQAGAVTGMIYLFP